MKKSLYSFYIFEYRPNILIADAAQAITNGFMKAFEYESEDEFIRVMCWAHVERNCEDKSNYIEVNTRDEIIQDIKDMQAMPSTSSFNKALELFFEKWKDIIDVSKFIEHFKTEWIEKNKGWYEGFTDGHIPSTDNGLEAENRVVKDNHTLRERMPIPQYMHNSCGMIKDWSLDRFPKEGKKAEKPFCEEPLVTKEYWTMAFDFLYGEGKIKATIKKTRGDVFICTRKENDAIIHQHYIHGRYHLLNCNFEDFIKYFKKVHLVKLDKENWAKSKCNCSWFLKNYFCYH